MAGIGFELNRLVQRDNLTDVLRAYIYTALAAVGPWIYTVFVLAFITVVQISGNNGELMNFRTIVIYNFSISLVLTAPIFMVTTRMLSDAIHAHNVTAIPTIMYQCLGLSLLVNLPIAALWYLTDFYDLTTEVRVMAFANLAIITAIWVLAVFLLALKDYMAVSKSFLFGHLLAFFLVYVQISSTNAPMTTFSLLLCFSIGLVTIVGLLIGRILAEYPYHYDVSFRLLPYFKKYWPLALGGLFYNAAIWVDKWIMWFAPESVQLPSLMRIFPSYDHAMFMAIMFSVPAFVLFVVSVETNFFNHYQRFFGDILAHRPLDRIMKRHGEMLGSVHEGTRQLIMIQGLFTLLAIVFAPSIITFLYGTMAELSIFRLAALGGFFHLLMLTATIILSYFDCRKQVMWIYLVFLLANIHFTLITLKLGFAYYAYGYFAASVVAFVVASIVLFVHLRDLLYHAFITNNLSVKETS